MPLAAELSVLIRVSGRGKPSSCSVMRRGKAVCPLWNIPPTSDSAVDATTCFRILYSVWIGVFAGGGRFGDFSGSVCSAIRL